MRNYKKKEAQVYCYFYLCIWIIFKEMFKLALRQIYWLMYFTVRGHSSQILHLKLYYIYLYKDSSLFGARIPFFGDQLLLM